MPASNPKCFQPGCCSNSACVKRIALLRATTSAWMPKPTAGVRYPYQAVYLGESEKYLRIPCQFPPMMSDAAAWCAPI